MQSFLLAASSPFLASLLSQAFLSPANLLFVLIWFLSQAGSSPCISLPCSPSLLSSLITSLVNGQVFGEEQEQLASLLGIINCNQTSNSAEKFDDSRIGQGLPARVKREREISSLQGQADFCSEEPKPKDITEQVVVKLQQNILEPKSSKEKEKEPKSKYALCNVCSEMFSNKKDLRIHIKTHDKEENICDVCSKFFCNIYSLKTHILTHTQKKTECQICFQSVFAFKAHMRRNHGDSELVTCSNCGAEVKRIGKHEKICKMTKEEKAAHRENLKVKCEHCSKVLANKNLLARHNQSAHSKERLLECNFCDHKDSRKDNMKTHVKNNHSQIS